MPQILKSTEIKSLLEMLRTPNHTKLRVLTTTLIESGYITKEQAIEKTAPGNNFTKAVILAVSASAVGVSATAAAATSTPEAAAGRRD